MSFSPWGGRPFFAAAFLAAAAFIACSGGDDQTPQPPTEQAPTSTGPATNSGQGQVGVSLEARCVVSQERAELIVTYGARAEGGARLSRVKLLVNNQQIEDSGPLSQAEYRRVATIQAEAGRTYSYQVVAESPGLVAPAPRSFVTCPQPPTPTPGPRF